MTPIARKRDPNAGSRRQRPAPSVSATPPRDGRRLAAYEPALRVALRHGYYGHADDGDPFRVLVARGTAADLRAHGILVRTSRDEIVVVRDSARRVHRQQPGARPDWIALMVYGADDAFAAVSDVDMPAGGARDCLYVTNAGDGAAAPGVPASALRSERLAFLPATMTQALGPGQRLDVLSLAGDTMLDLDVPANGAAAAGYDVRYDAAARRAVLDLRGLPAGRYVVRVDGAPVATGLRLAADLVPAAFLELLLPPNGECGDYALAFQARSTFWKYTVVPRPGSGPLDSLAIGPAANGGAPRDQAAPAFLGPFDETLGNGASVQQFLSAAPIPLASRSAVRLRLTGRRKERMTRESVLVEYLPVPAKHQLALLTDRDLERLGTAERLCSEVFVYV